MVELAFVSGSAVAVLEEAAFRGCQHARSLPFERLPFKWMRHTSFLSLSGDLLRRLETAIAAFRLAFPLDGCHFILLVGQEWAAIASNTFALVS